MRQTQVCKQGHRWDPVADRRADAQERWDLCPTCGASAEMFSLRGSDPAESPPDGNGAADTPRASAPDTADPHIPGYALLGEVGRGGMGVIYKARHLGSQEIVALKMISAGLQAAPLERARFRAEGEAVSRLHHPHIVRVLEVGEQDGRPFFALEFMDRGSLASCIEGNPLMPRYAAVLLEILARAVQYAHDHGVVHRDLKPSNILLAEPPTDGTPVVRLLGLPKITDFGLAKRIGDEGGLTATGVILGTPNYMAPEQAGGGSKTVGPLADVYGLGAILYECLTGRPPFRGATILETLDQVRNTDPTPPSRLRPDVPRELETICLRALAKEPGRRYPSAAAMADDLNRFQGGAAIRARPVGAGERAVRWARRRPAAAGLIALALLVVVAGSGVGAWLWRDAAARTAKDDAAKRDAAAKQQADDEAKELKATYYANIVRRWGVPQGVGPLTEKQAHRRSLSFRFFSRGGVVERVEAVDRRGKPTVEHGDIAYLQKPRSGRGNGGPVDCSWQYERDAQGNLKDEVARDPAGDVVWTFHFTTRTTGYYTDEQGFPRPQVGSGAAFVAFTWSADGLEMEQRYLDHKGKPRPDLHGLFGLHTDHDARGFVSATIYLGPQDRPMPHPDGFAKQTRSHDDDGDLIEQAYFGLDGRPALCQYGYARIHYTYDDDGNETGWRVEDPNGKPTIDASIGVAAARLTYDERGNPATWTGLDVDGKVARDSRHVAKYVYTYDDHGNLIGRSCFDPEGNPTLRGSTFAEGTVAWRYNDRGDRIETAYSAPYLYWGQGVTRERLVRDEHGRILECAYFGAKDEPIADADGVVRYTFAYDDHGHETVRRYLGVDGKPTAGIHGAARTTRAYDDRGHIVEIANFDLDDRPVVPKPDPKLAPGNQRFGASSHITVTPTGNLDFAPLFSAAGVTGWTYAARTTHAYDESGNPTETATYGADGKPLTIGTIRVARMRYAYDEYGKLTEIATFDAEGKPITVRDRYMNRKRDAARTTMKYDEWGALLEFATYGADGRLAADARGVARMTWTRDVRGNLTSEAYFGADGRPVDRLADERLGTNHWHGYARAVYTYNQDDQVVASSFFDAADRPIPVQIVCSESTNNWLPDWQGQKPDLKIQDVFLTYDGQELSSAWQFTLMKNREGQGGDRKELKVLRSGKPLTVRVPTGPWRNNYETRHLEEQGWEMLIPLTTPNVTIRRTPDFK